jgi:formylglycine-generating enzyme required for sulfatase activity
MPRHLIAPTDGGAAAIDTVVTPVWGSAMKGVPGVVLAVALAKRETNARTKVPVGNGRWETNPVGSYPEGRSAFGVLDMAGNVAEWTADWYGSYPTKAEANPQGPRTGTSRVIRGGGWLFVTFNNRAADRNWPDPSDQTIDLGFCCAQGK